MKGEKRFDMDKTFCSGCFTTIKHADVWEHNFFECMRFVSWMPVESFLKHLTMLYEFLQEHFTVPHTFFDESWIKQIYDDRTKLLMSLRNESPPLDAPSPIFKQHGVFVYLAEA